MTYPSAGGPANWAAQVEDVIAGRAAAALQIGTTSVDSALSRQLARAGIDDPATVTALDAATASQFTTLSDCGPNMANVLLQLRSATADIMSNADYSNAYRTRQVVEARNKAQASLDDIQATAIKAAAKIRAQLDAILNPPANSDPTVSELQIAGAWGVAQPFLGGAVTGDTISKLCNMNVPGMFAALRRYLPLTVMAQYSTAPKQHQEQYVESALLQLDAAEEPTLGKASRRARALQAQMLVALGRLQTGYLQASGEINGTQRVGVLAGPDGAIQVRG